MRHGDPAGGGASDDSRPPAACWGWYSRGRARATRRSVRRFSGEPGGAHRRGRTGWRAVDHRHGTWPSADLRAPASRRAWGAPAKGHSRCASRLQRRLAPDGVHGRGRGSTTSPSSALGQDANRSRCRDPCPSGRGCPGGARLEQGPSHRSARRRRGVTPAWRSTLRRGFQSGRRLARIRVGGQRPGPRPVHGRRDPLRGLAGELGRDQHRKPLAG